MKDNREEATLWAILAPSEGWWLEDEEDYLGEPEFSSSICWAQLYPNEACAQQTADKINQHYEAAGSPIRTKPVKVHARYEVEL